MLGVDAGGRQLLGRLLRVAAVGDEHDPSGVRSTMAADPVKPVR